MLVHIFLFYMAFTICKSVYIRMKEYMIVILCCWFGMFLETKTSNEGQIPVSSSQEDCWVRSHKEHLHKRSVVHLRIVTLTLRWKPRSESHWAIARGVSWSCRLHQHATGHRSPNTQQYCVQIYFVALTLSDTKAEWLTCNWTGHWTRDSPYGPMTTPMAHGHHHGHCSSDPQNTIFLALTTTCGSVQCDRQALWTVTIGWSPTPPPRWSILPQCDRTEHIVVSDHCLGLLEVWPPVWDGRLRWKVIRALPGQLLLSRALFTLWDNDRRHITPWQPGWLCY